MHLANLAWLCAFGVFLMSSPLIAGEGGGTSSTSYWYGGGLHPLVITRDGVTYRLIGKSVVEALAGDQATRSYAHADHLGSVRLVTDDGGSLLQSLSYDDYGLTRIAGESTAATDGSVASFYRFQGQEQEVLPLAKLGIDDPSLAAWLDQIQLYHFPWRDYAAGLAAFTQTDPIPTQDSLYAALAANPVNATDETGGMWDFTNTYTPLHRAIPRFIQNLFDALENDPDSLTMAQLKIVDNFHVSVNVESYNPNNPYDTELYWLALEAKAVPDELIPERLNELLQKLREERLAWLDRYRSPLMNAYRRRQDPDFIQRSNNFSENGALRPVPLRPDDDGGGIVGLGDEEEEVLFLSDESEEQENAAEAQAPSMQAPAVVAREVHSQAQEDEKAEYEVKEEAKSHQPHGDMQE